MIDRLCDMVGAILILGIATSCPVAAGSADDGHGYHITVDPAQPLLLNATLHLSNDSTASRTAIVRGVGGAGIDDLLTRYVGR